LVGCQAPFFFSPFVTCAPPLADGPKSPRQAGAVGASCSSDGAISALVSFASASSSTGNCVPDSSGDAIPTGGPSRIVPARSGVGGADADGSSGTRGTGDDERGSGVSPIGLGAAPDVVAEVGDPAPVCAAMGTSMTGGPASGADKTHAVRGSPMTASKEQLNRSANEIWERPRRTVHVLRAPQSSR
jgi:hypothetical protein